MATRIENILLRARDTLADPQGERWSDARLIRLLDEGQQDVAKHTKILKGEVDLLVNIDQAIYDLPSDVWLLTRAAYNNCKIDFYSHSQLDHLVKTQALNQNYSDNNTYYSSGAITSSSCWETDTGSKVEALVYDRRNMEQIRIYPIVNSNEDVTFDSDNNDFIGSELLGVTTGIDNYTFNSAYGVVTEIYDPNVESTFNSVFGVLTGVAAGRLHLWYVRMPSTVTDISSELEIPKMFDTALKHYVVSNAFDDDYDTRVAEKAQKAAALYERELGIAQDTQAKDGIRDGQTRKTTYRGAFN